MSDNYPEPPRTDWGDLPLVSEADDPEDYRDVWGAVLDDEGFKNLKEQIIVPFDTYDDFPSEGPFDGAKAEAQNSNVVFRWDESADDWIALNTGTSDDPVPGTSHFESVEADDLNNESSVSTEDEFVEALGDADIINIESDFDITETITIEDPAVIFGNNYPHENETGGDAVVIDDPGSCWFHGVNIVANGTPGLRLLDTSRRTLVESCRFRKGGDGDDYTIVLDGAIGSKLRDVETAGRDNGILIGESSDNVANFNYFEACFAQFHDDVAYSVQNGVGNVFDTCDATAGGVGFDVGSNGVATHIRTPWLESNDGPEMEIKGDESTVTMPYIENGDDTIIWESDGGRLLTAAGGLTIEGSGGAKSFVFAPNADEVSISADAYIDGYGPVRVERDQQAGDSTTTYTLPESQYLLFEERGSSGMALYAIDGASLDVEKVVDLGDNGTVSFNADDELEIEAPSANHSWVIHEFGHTNAGIAEFQSLN